MERYEYWTHDHTGEHYLVRFDPAGLISGVCGPMMQSQIPGQNRRNYDYDSQPQYTDWLRRHTSEFHSLAPGNAAACSSRSGMGKPGTGLNANRTHEGDEWQSAST